MTPTKSLSERIAYEWDTPSLSERLRRIAGGALEFEDDEAAVREAADALDAKDAQIRAANDALFDVIYDGKAALDAQAAEIELLKEGRKLHDEWADHLEHVIAQAAAALENAACAGVKGASEALAAIRASAGEAQPLWRNTLKLKGNRK